VVSEQQQLAGALGDTDGLRRAYADRYAAFRRTYCSLEDGRAADRVIALLEEASGSARR
jgi:CDP-glycerol glycerophosphotransferase